MLISKNLHKKSSEVSIKKKVTPASLSFIGQATKHTTIKWTIPAIYMYINELRIFRVKAKGLWKCVFQV